MLERAGGGTRVRRPCDARRPALQRPGGRTATVRRRRADDGPRGWRGAHHPQPAIRSGWSGSWSPTVARRRSINSVRRSGRARTSRPVAPVCATCCCGCVEPSATSSCGPGPACASPGVSCDLLEFDRLAARCAVAPRARTRSWPADLAHDAIEAGDGTVFVDFEYDEWAITARRAAEQQLIGLFDLLSVQAQDAGDLPLAQSLAERALRLDRYTDSRYVRLAELLTLQDRVAAAIAVLDDAAEVARELGGALPSAARRSAPSARPGQGCGGLTRSWSPDGAPPVRLTLRGATKSPPLTSCGDRLGTSCGDRPRRSGANGP